MLSFLSNSPDSALALSSPRPAVVASHGRAAFVALSHGEPIPRRRRPLVGRAASTHGHAAFSCDCLAPTTPGLCLAVTALP